MLFCKHNPESFILQSCGDFLSSVNEVDRLIILRTKELMLPQSYAPKMENLSRKKEVCNCCSSIKIKNSITGSSFKFQVY